jgi:hypothetical protein
VELCRKLLRNLILQRLIGVLCRVLVGSHLLSLEVVKNKILTSLNIMDLDQATPVKHNF